MNKNSIQFVRAIDGDTIVVNIPGVPAVLGHLISIRLKGIQCPELRNKDKNQKGRAIAAQQYTQRCCSRAERITLENCKRGKFFRIIADVFCDGKHLNADLLRNKLAEVSKY